MVGKNDRTKVRRPKYVGLYHAFPQKNSLLTVERGANISTLASEARLRTRMIRGNRSSLC